MRVRFTGDDESRDLAISGACLVFPRGKWLDPEQLAAEANVPVEHLAIVVRGLGPGWEIDEKPPRTREAKTTTPDEGDKEQAT